MHAMATRSTRLAAALLVAALSSGCRTRLLDVLDDIPPEDGGTDLAMDLSQPPDLTIPKDNCGAWEIVTTRIIRPSLLVIQDKSRSMGWGVDGNRNPPAGQSKWELTRAAIKEVVTKTAYVDWGLMLFGTGGCEAPLIPDVAVAPDNAGRIRAVLDSTVLDSGTPTTVTINNAVAWYGKRTDKNPHYMLLSTDGLPACGPGGTSNSDDSTAAVLAVRRAAAAGIPTFVVGIGSTTDAESTLNAMARAGGVPNTTPFQPDYFPVGSSQDLVDVLDKAVVKITPCSYPLEHQPPDRDRVTIQSPTGIIPRDIAHMNGWDYGDDGVSVAFYGPACDELKKGVVTSVEAVYGCPGDLTM